MRKTNQLAEIEISYNPKMENTPTISSSDEAAGTLFKYYDKSTIALQEQFVVMFLNRANKFLGIHQHSKGSMTGTTIDVKIIISIAIKIAASGIIISHNHPSGNTTPSISDKELTTKVKTACEYFDITFLDHVILSPNGDYYSLKQEDDF